MKGAREDLEAARPFDRGRIVEEMEKHLTTQPTRPTSRRKVLPGLVPPWEHEPPVWELRVGEHRVFYDVDEAAKVVLVRAVRRKGNKTTKDIV